MHSNIKGADYYLVYNDYSHFSYEKELNLLYLPIIGNDAIRIYQYFFTKLLNDKNITANTLHFDIIDNLSIDLKRFLLARKKLEALGLLKTYVLERDNKVFYMYKILKPLSFYNFFNSALLSTLLEGKIGKEQYKILLDRYQHNKIDFSTFKDITAKFTDVYSYENIDTFSFEELTESYDYSINLEEFNFDINKLIYLLSNKYLEELLDDEDIKKDILGLAYLYKVTPLEMANAIEKSVDNNTVGLELNIEKLKTHLSQLFITVKKQNVPELDEMLNKQLLKESYSETKELSPKEAFAKKLDNINYVEFLNKKHKIILSNIDGENINKLQTKYNFNSGVLNVLLDYAIIESKSSGVPNFNYLDKIASTWSNKRLVSALSAINFVNSQRNSFKQNKLEKNNSIFNTSSSNTIDKKIDYNLESVDFIRLKYEFILPTKLEKDLNIIKEKYNFSNEILNYILEKAINESDSKSDIPHINYIESIAANWFKNKVKTIKDIEKLNKPKNEINRKVNIVRTPDYIKKQLQNIDENSNYEETNNDNYSEFRKLLEKRGLK